MSLFDSGVETEAWRCIAVADAQRFSLNQTQKWCQRIVLKDDGYDKTLEREHTVGF